MNTTHYQLQPIAEGSNSRISILTLTPPLSNSSAFYNQSYLFEYFEEQDEDELPGLAFQNAESNEKSLGKIDLLNESNYSFQKQEKVNGCNQLSNLESQEEEIFNTLLAPAQNQSLIQKEEKEILLTKNQSPAEEQQHQIKIDERSIINFSIPQEKQLNSQQKSSHKNSEKKNNSNNNAVTKSPPKKRKQKKAKNAKKNDTEISSPISLATAASFSEEMLLSPLQQLNSVNNQLNLSSCNSAIDQPFQSNEHFTQTSEFSINAFQQCSSEVKNMTSFNGISNNKITQSLNNISKQENTELIFHNLLSKTFSSQSPPTKQDQNCSSRTILNSNNLLSPSSISLENLNSIFQNPNAEVQSININSLNKSTKQQGTDCSIEQNQLSKNNDSSQKQLKLQKISHIPKGLNISSQRQSEVLSAQQKIMSNNNNYNINKNQHNNKNSSSNNNSKIIDVSYNGNDNKDNQNNRNHNSNCNNINKNNQNLLNLNNIQHFYGQQVKIRKEKLISQESNQQDNPFNFISSHLPIFYPLIIKQIINHENESGHDKTCFSLYNEFTLQSQMHHPHILKPLQLQLLKGNHAGECYIIYPKAESDLFDLYLSQHESKNSSNLDEIRTMMIQVSSALEYVHDKMNIVHSDIKPENIYKLNHSSFVLADFGLAHPYKFSVGSCLHCHSHLLPQQLIINCQENGEDDEQDTYFNQFKEIQSKKNCLCEQFSFQTRQSDYFSPEIIEYMNQLDNTLSKIDEKKSDVFALGMSLFVCIFKKYPCLQKCSLDDPLYNYLASQNKKVKDCFWKRFAPALEFYANSQDNSRVHQLVDLLENMLNPNPQERYSASMVCSHPWLKLSDNL